MTLQLTLQSVLRELTPHYGADCPVVVVFRAAWRDESVISGALADIREKVRAEKITRTALIFVGRVFDEKTVEDRRHYPRRSSPHPQAALAPAV